MKRTIEELEIRIHQLEKRDPVINKNIINKLKRRIRLIIRSDINYVTLMHYIKTDKLT